MSVCRDCGCTDFQACFSPTLGACSWTEPDLCSHCANKVEDVVRPEDPEYVGLTMNYKLIPMDEITDEARMLAVAWGEEHEVPSVENKHKLASDIMNYARRYHESQMAGGTKAEAEAVIILFNETFARKISLTAYRQRAICARFKEGKKLKPPVTLEQFRAVFEYKKEKWTGTDQEQYLEIETLVAQKHFFKYLDQARADKDFIHRFKIRYGTAQSTRPRGEDNESPAPVLRPN